MNTLYSCHYPSDMGSKAARFGIVEGGDGGIGVRCDDMYIGLPDEALPHLLTHARNRMEALTAPEPEPETADLEALSTSKGEGPTHDGHTPQNDWHCGNAHLRDEWAVRLITKEPRIATSAGWAESLDAAAYIAGPRVIRDLITRLEADDVPF